MAGVNDIVITGLGCVTPIGIGCQAFRDGLLAGRCAVRPLYTLDDVERTTLMAATIDDFDGKGYVKPRKALKVMSREVQIAYSSAHLAWQDAGLEDADLVPDRLGVVYGSEMIPGDYSDLVSATRACSDNGSMEHTRWGGEFSKQIYPLWMLKNLPNMPACHIGIAIDARGPNNTIAQEETSSLLALAEAAMIIERDQADLMVVGGVGARTTPTRLMYRPRQLYHQHPFDVEADGVGCLPFDVSRRGIVPSEGAGAIVIERRSHAVKRGARILARLSGFASRYSRPESRFGGSRQSIQSAAQAALQAAGIQASELDHICAQGFSHPQLDIEEGAAIHTVAGDTPVTAFSSYMGTAGAACGALELIASIIGINQGKTLPTIGHRQTDSACSVTVCTEATDAHKSHFLKLSFTPYGQAAAAVLECEN